MSGRVPPHDTNAEEYVLSAMLFDADAVTAVLNILTPDDFYKPEYAATFKALESLYTQGIVIDSVSLAAELNRNGTLQGIGGNTFISTLTSAFYTSVNTLHHALEIKRHAESRRIIKDLTELQNKPDGVTVDDVMTLARAVHENQFIHEFANRAAQRIDDFKLSLRSPKPRILTGFKQLDGITGGFRIPSVAMIGAYPSVGKTAFAINIADKVLKEAPIVFFSLEMSCDMIFERLASSKMKIDYGLFINQRLNEKQYCAVEKLAEAMKRFKFNVFDDTYYIEQQSRIISNLKPKLVVVDYVQKVRTHRKTDSRRIEIDYISGMYKQIAKQNDCVILLLSQLSRPDKGINLKKHRPTMASLKESGALEADGDYIGILHRPYVLVKDDPDIKKENASLLIDKNKYGNVGDIPLYFDGRFQRFYECDTYHQLPMAERIETYGTVQNVEPGDDMPF